MRVLEGTAEFLARLRSLDISVRMENSRLRINAPKDALTPALREQLAERKAEIIAFLSRSVMPSGSEPVAIERIPRDGKMPLSFAQSRLWFLDQLMPGSTAYTFPMYVRLKGALDIGVLERCLTEICRRHEILRTVFPSVNGTPSQVMLPATTCIIPVVEVPNVSSEGKEKTALRLANEESRLPFDLAHGPLWRVKLLRLQEQDHLLLLHMHHIIFDGSSIDVFWQELAALYVAYRAGDGSPLPELPIQYVDFASWQKKMLEGSTRESHLAYWKQQLGENPPDLNLATDRPMEGEEERLKGGKIPLELTPALTALLKGMSQREQASLSMTLLAAWKLLLHRWAGQEQILVGMPVAGRSRSEFEKMIGIFVNTMVVRTNFSESLSFRELLHQVRGTMLDALEHQDMPFEELVGALDPRRDVHRTPLFQAFFNNLNMQLTPVEIPGLQIEPFGEFEVEAKFDVSLYVYEHSSAISLMLVYNRQRFEESTMTALLEQYASLLQQVCDDSSRTIWEYSLVAGKSAEKAGLPDPKMPLSNQQFGLIHSEFLKRALEAPDKIALEDENGQWSYKELAALSAGLSQRLRDMGVGSGDVVAVYGHRSAPLVLALLGILRSGGAFCILDPSYPDLRLASCVRTARPKAWIGISAAGSPSELLESAISETAGSKRLTLPETPRNVKEFWSTADASVEEGVEDRPAYIAFTSGSTGEPKCVLGTHNPVAHFLQWHIRTFGLNESDRFSMLSGLAHDPLLRDIFTPLWVGGTLAIPNPQKMLEPGRLSHWIASQRITVAHLTPAMQSLLTVPGTRQDETRPASVLRMAFFGGDVVSTRDFEALREIAPNARCVSFYGATETPQAMSWCAPEIKPRTTFLQDQPGWSKQIPIGNPIDDVQLLVLNRAGKLTGIGELGEINIRTPYLSLGYSNDANLSQVRFPINPFTRTAGDRLYRTGDLARYRADGMVEFAGRADQQIKIRGFRVELREVELVLEKCPGVHDCAIVVEGHSPETKRLVAYFSSNENPQPAVEDLRAHVGKILPDYQVPAEFHCLPALPMTPNGKIDRNALASGRFRTSAPKLAVQPRNVVEARIAEVWQQVLELETVGIFDNFFELGGQSLTATRLIAQLGAAFEVEIPLQALFLEPTIAGLAQHVEYEVGSGKYRYVSTLPAWKCVVAAQPKGTRTPFFFVAGYQGPDDALLVLSRFVPHLGSNQPVFGFRPRWIQGAGEKCSSIEETAREFVTELRTIQEHGPYLLGGHCVGGVVAVEMARQLISEGEAVEFLALLDTERPSAYRAFLAELRLTFHRLSHMREVIGEIMRSRGAERKAIIQRVISRKVKTRVEQLPASDNSFYENKVSYRRQAYRHRVTEYPGRITLFVNDQQYRFDRYMGWKGIAKRGLEIYRIPGDHDTVLQVHGKKFAEVLLQCLDGARAEGPEPLARSAEVCS